MYLLLDTQIETLSSSTTLFGLVGLGWGPSFEDNVWCSYIRYKTNNNKMFQSQTFTAKNMIWNQTEGLCVM